MPRATPLWLTCAILAATLAGASAQQAAAQDATGKSSQPLVVLVTRPVEVTDAKTPRYRWLMGLIDAYCRVRLSGRDELEVLSAERVTQALPAYANADKAIDEDAYVKLAQSLGASFVLFQKYEYAEKEATVHYYVELQQTPDLHVVSSFEKTFQTATMAVELDDALLQLCEQVKLPASERAAKFFETFLISGVPGKQKSFGELAAADFYATGQDQDKLGRKYAALARDEHDMPICSKMAAACFLRAKNYKDAITSLKTFQAAFSTHGPTYQQLCEAYRLNNQPADAVESAKAARKIGYEPVPVLVEQLRGLDALGKKDEAYAVALEILGRDKQEPFALRFVARWRNNENRFAEALQLAEDLLKLEPNNGGAFLEKGRAQVGLGKPADAIMPLTQAIVLMPRDAEPHLVLGDIYFNRKEYAKAAEHFAEACKSKSDDLDLFLRTGYAYELASQLAVALKTLQAVEPRYPDDARLNAKIGLYQFALKDTAGARAHLEKRMRTSVDDSLVFLALGDIYAAAKEYLKAINVYEQVVPLVKDKNRLRIVLAQLFLKKGEPNNSLPYLEQIASESPNYPGLYRWFGDAYREATQTDKAIENYKKERSARGDDPYIQEQIAALYFKADKYQEAETECLRLAKVDPKNANAYYRLSIIALHAKNPTLAESYLAKASAIGDADEETYFRMGEGYAGLSRWDAAEKAYRKCVEKNPQRYKAWAGLADVQLKAGKDSLCAETYMKITSFNLPEYSEYPAMAGKLFEKLKLPPKAAEAYNTYLGRRGMSEDVNLRLARIEYANKNYEAVHRLLGNQVMKGSLSEADNMLLAESYVAMSNYPEAMPLLRKAVLLEPQNRRAIELAAAAAVQLGDKPTTIDMYKKFLELPKSPEHAEYAFKVAQLYEQVRDRASAQTWYQTNIKNYPQDIRNYERRAQLCIDDKEWDCAQKTLEAGGALPTATPEIKRMLAALYERLNMHEKAIDQYANYLTNTPNDSAALLSTGTLYYNQRQYQKTVDLLKKAHSLMPQNFESAFMLADSYMKLGRTQEAIDAFLEARRIKSKDDRVLSSLAQCYTTLQDTKNLIPILREWLFLDESNVDVKTRLGKALLAVHNTSEGARLLESVSRERPDDVEVHRLLYKTYQSTGDEELFVSHLKSALATSEYKADLYYELGKYYLRKDRRAQAMEYLQKAVDADGRMNAARYEYAQMLRQTGNTLEAWNQASKCIELDPYNASYLLLHSQVAYQMNKKDEATESVLKSLKIDSTNADALAWAGFLGNDAKTTDQSRPMLQRAIKVNPNCALCYEYLGDAYQLEANYPLAAQNYEKSLGLRAYSEATSVKLAKCVLLSGQPEKAGLLFEKILGMNAGNDEALYWLSHVYVTLGRLAEAEKLPQTYKFAKKTGWLHLAQGEVYEKQGNINAALISFSVASRLIPDEPLMLAATGRMNLVKKEYEDAVQNFGKALGQDPHNPRYLLELGKAYEGLTDFASALALYDEVIRTNPQYTDVFYFAARALSRSGDHAKAIEMLTKGLQRLDGDLRLTLALAHEYRAIGQYPKAIKFFEQVAESGKPEYVDGYRFVGMVYYDNLKEQSKAKKYFTKYVEAGGTDPKVKDLLATIP